MAVHALILKMEADGIPATMELPDGKWCHTPEYVKRRYAGSIYKVKVNKPAAPKQDRFMELLDVDVKKMTPSERALLMAQLEDE